MRSSKFPDRFDTKKLVGNFWISASIPEVNQPCLEKQIVVLWLEQKIEFFKHKLDDM